MRRLIVVGANGVGKSHVASRLSEARPEIPLVSFDAIKLTSDWKLRPRPEIDMALSQIVASDAWILEGGPSLLFQALPKAEVVIWLDPPELVRAWRLMIRPWRNLGKTRPELPPDNVDWPLQQYRFAIRSIKNRSKFRSHISTCLAAAETPHVWHCRNQRQVDAAVDEWRVDGH
jgi:adenylate kinase family enzyme